MNARERFSNAVGFKEADRIPISFGTAQDSIHRDGEKALFEYYGIHDGETRIMDLSAQNVLPDERLLKRFHSDTLQLFPNPPSGYEPVIKDEGDYYTVFDRYLG